MIHRTIFVDDSNPAINYGGGWKPLRGVQTEGLSSGIPGQSPLYGTMHALDAAVVGTSWNITYRFNGETILYADQCLHYESIDILIFPIRTPSF